MSRARGRICGIENCRSRRFHVGADGHTYCSNGHQAEDQLTEIDENAYTGRAGARVTRRRSDEVIETTKVYQGLKGIELALQCFQLILRKQVHWLIHSHGYPEQLETVVRDLWCLRAQMLRDIRDSSTNGESSQQLFSTQSDTENSDAADPEGSVKVMLIDRKFPKLTESLSLLYLGLVLMKIPICSGDVNEWLGEEGFVYLQALSVIPRSMVRKLAPQWQQMFTPQVDLNYDQYQGFHVTTRNLVVAFQRKVGMMIPAINYNLLLSRFVIALSLPVELIRLVNRLARLVNARFEFPSAKKKGYHKLATFPEVQLMGLLIVAVKLIYPFDEIPRHPLSASEPAVMGINWNQWQEVRNSSKEASEQRNKRNAKELLETTEDQVFKMTDSQIDKYLDWFSRTWVDDDEGEHDMDTDFQRAIKQMFPLDTNDGRTDRNSGGVIESSRSVESIGEDLVLKSVQTAMKPNTIVLEDEARVLGMDIIRPGERYLNYRTVEVLPVSAKPLFESAAEMVGLSLSSMVAAVNQTERKIENWSKRAHREHKS